MSTPGVPGLAPDAGGDANGLPVVDSDVTIGVTKPTCGVIGVMNGVSLPGAGGPNASIVGVDDDVSGVVEAAEGAVSGEMGVSEASGGCASVEVGRSVGLAGGGAVNSARVGETEFPAV